MYSDALFKAFYTYQDQSDLSRPIVENGIAPSPINLLGVHSGSHVPL